jgi:acyl-coenzyme A synthetase/AMP-(fatty) acid ligase
LGLGLTSTQDQLLKKVCKLANALKAEGVKKGDRRFLGTPWNVFFF